MKAGLFDRAEEAYQALEGTAFDTEARLALLTLHERSRDWRAAVEVAQQARAQRHRLLRLAHRALLVRDRAGGRRTPADRRGRRRACASAREAAPQAPRPLVLAGQRARAPRRPRAGACRPGASCWPRTRRRSTWWRATTPPARIACGEQAAALERLQALYRRAPTTDLLAAIAALDADPPRQRQRLLRAPAASSRRCRPRRRCCASRRRARRSTTPKRKACATPWPRRQAAAALPLRRLRLRGAALLLAMPRLPELGQLPAATPGGSVMTAPALTRERLAARPRAGGRRRDARPLLVRRRRPHLARGAGAGGARQPRGGAPGRRRQRGAERQDAGRAGHAADRRRRRRAGAHAAAAARAARACRRCWAATRSSTPSSSCA